MRLVVFVVLAAMVAATLVTVAFSSDEPPSPGVVVDWIRGTSTDQRPVYERTSTPVESGEPPPMPTASPPPPTVAPEALTFAYPIDRACLPEDDNLMPGATREYRQGIHEGVDFYDSDNCAFIGLDAEVLAAKAGTVIRADRAYEDLTRETLAQLLERIEQGDSNDPAVEDAFRGRQVWVDHGDGIVTRYAHLGGIADGIVAGVEVQQGEVIAYVGDSGTPESVTAPDTQVHLHFEVRIGDAFLGHGLSPDEARRLYHQASLSQ